jgi:hypothetical protein
LNKKDTVKEERPNWGPVRCWWTSDRKTRGNQSDVDEPLTEKLEESNETEAEVSTNVWLKFKAEGVFITRYVILSTNSIFKFAP